MRLEGAGRGAARQGQLIRLRSRHGRKTLLYRNIKPHLLVIAVPDPPATWGVGAPQLFAGQVRRLDHFRGYAVETIVDILQLTHRGRVKTPLRIITGGTGP